MSMSISINGKVFHFETKRGFVAFCRALAAKHLPCNVHVYKLDSSRDTESNSFMDMYLVTMNGGSALLEVFEIR